MLPIPETKLDLIKKKTEKDGALIELMTTVKNGWLSNKADVAPGAKPYWNYPDEIKTSVIDIVFCLVCNKCSNLESILVNVL